jgi:protein FAM32A
MPPKDDPFAATVGGALKLKGGPGRALSVASGGVSKLAATHPVSAAGVAPGGARDSRTAAEKAFEARLAVKEAKDAAKAAQSTHRQKVAAFNDALAKLSEHHDIPRVGPG